MKSSAMDPMRRRIAIVAVIAAIVGLGFLYSFHRQNSELSNQHKGLILSFQKCERSRQRCESDLTVCTSLGTELRTFNTDTTNQLKLVKKEMSAKQQELLTFKESSAELKRQLESVRADSVTSEKELSETRTKLSEAAGFTKSIIQAVDSNADVYGEVTKDLVNGTVSKIRALKNEIVALKKKIADLTPKPTSPSPKATTAAIKVTEAATKSTVVPGPTESASKATKIAIEATMVAPEVTIAARQPTKVAINGTYVANVAPKATTAVPGATKADIVANKVAPKATSATPEAAKIATEAIKAGVIDTDTDTKAEDVETA